MKKITSFLLFTTSLFLYAHGSQSNYFCTTNTSQAISPNELWSEGKEELSKEKLEQSLAAGFEPSKIEINRLLEKAAKNNQRNIIEWLLTQPHGIPMLEHYHVNHVFRNAASKNNRNLMEWLLTQPHGIPLPGQLGVNRAFSSAAFSNNRNLVEWLLTQPHGIPLPNQDGVTRALNNARLANNYALMEWLLTQPHGIPLSDRYETVNLYRELCSRRPSTGELERVLSRMDLLVPEQERIYQGRGPRQIIQNRAMAFEVHDYADTLVSESSHSASASATGTSEKLSDIIFNKIYSLIRGIVPVEIDLVPLRLQSAVEHIYAGQPEKITLATQALDNSYRLQDAKLYLRTVMTFLDHLPESELKFDLWFKGFIEESIEAYKNSQNKLSCVKGIQERILTGLRGVDKELDQIFKHAEAPLLMTNYINQQFNVHNESVQHDIAIMLKKSGITPQSPLIDAQRALENDLRSKLKEYQVEIPADIQESIPEIIEIFGNIYDEKIKPLLRTPIHPELSFKQEETSKRSG